MLPFIRPVLSGGRFDLAREVAKAGGAVYYQDSLWGAADHLPRRNLLTYSEDFSNAAWTKTAATLGAGITPPSGVGQSVKIIPTAATTAHKIERGSFSVANGVEVKLTVYAKAGEHSWIVLYAGGVGIGKCFNVSSGALGSNYIGAPADSIITAVGNGWYLLSMTFTTASAFDIRIHASNADGVVSFLGDGTSGVYAAGAQLTATSTLDQSYQKITDWVTEQYAWAAAKAVSWLRRNRFTNTATLSTQTVSSVTATPLTVSFTGTGTITFSTAYTGSLVGTGASDRVSLTFTPAAGNLVCTVTGGVTLAQCEVGSVATEYQPIGASWDAQYAANAAAAGVTLTMFQDSAGTTAVSGPDQPIGRVVDASGNGYAATQSGATSLKPVLRLSANGGWYLQRDLVDDALSATFPNLGANCVEYIAGASTVTKTESVTLNGAKSMSTPAVDYGRVYLPAPSSKDAKIQQALQAKIK